MRATLVIASIALLLAFVTACQPVDDSIGDTQSAIAEGSPTALGLLQFVNTTTQTVLDVDVGLDKRAAANIVSHIDGTDGKRGTSDDNLFDSLAELDAVSYVGATALAKLSAYVTAHGLVPDLVVEGVPLSNAQAAAMVAVANQATQAQLDGDAKLDSRAAAAIVAARPIADLNALAAVKYVAKTALEHLRDYAPSFNTCTLADSPNQNAADLTQLLALATTLDMPAAEVVTLHATGCLDHQALVAALEAKINWRYDTSNRLPFSDGGFSAGSAQYTTALGSARDAIQGRVDEGSWDPASSPQLYGELSSLVTALSPAAGADYQQVTITLDAEECSQKAYVLIDTHTLEIRIVHNLPRC